MTDAELDIFTESFIIPLAIIVTFICFVVIGWVFMLYEEDNH